MMIMSFGIFAAVVITVNYILIILTLPSIYVCYEMHIRKRFTCFKWITNSLCKCFRKQRDEEIFHKLDEKLLVCNDNDASSSDNNSDIV